MAYGDIALEMTKHTGGNPWTSRGFWCSELVTTLRKVGFPHASYVKCDAKSPPLPDKDLVIVFFKGKPGGDYARDGHFVVRWGGMWMCSLKWKFIDDSEITRIKWIVYPNGIPTPTLDKA